MGDTLGDALPREIARVSAIRDSYRDMARDHPDLAWGLNVTIAVMTAEIQHAVSVCATGDVVEMLAAYQSLKDYTDG
jgi:hypothetical protein